MARIKRDKQHQDAKQVIDGSAIAASKLVRDLISGQRKRINYLRYQAAIFVLEQVLGKARIKAELKHTGTPLTYQELTESADEMIKKMKEAGEELPDVLKEALEVAEKAEQAQAEAEQRGDAEDKPSPEADD